jgi:uncharacterized protein with HEPN domain
MTDDRLADYLDHIRDAARLARSYVENMSREEFLADTRTQQAVILNLFVIGEAATKLLTEYPDFAHEHSAIAWKAMKGMRNRIAHGYFDVDLEIVWETVGTNLPELLRQLSLLASHT